MAGRETMEIPADCPSDTVKALVEGHNRLLGVAEALIDQLGPLHPDAERLRALLPATLIIRR